MTFVWDVGSLGEISATIPLSEICPLIWLEMAIHWLHNVKSEPDVQLQHQCFQENNTTAVNKTMGAFLILLDYKICYCTVPSLLNNYRNKCNAIVTIYIYQCWGVTHYKVLVGFCC